MAVEQQEPVYTQIRNLLMVFTLAIACAGAFAGILLYYYSPSGVYKLGNVMISPAMMDGRSYAAQSSKAGQNQRFSFDRLEFSYWNADARRWDKIPVSIESYSQFYDTFANEASIASIADSIINQFQQPPPSKLALSVRSASEDPTTTPTKSFQEVQFANNGDFYRVELHEQAAGGGGHNWAYFYHPRVYQEIMPIFIGKQEAP